ncbi:MAG: transglycosylase domain-containing protein, partial [Muribaculaceae bacterium]|nr:transglycosylase domain-containing protein [Muribaculaceae bacterium]
MSTIQQSDSNRQNKTKTRTRRFIVAMWALFVCGVVAVGVFFTLVYNGVVGYMPDVKSLKNPTDKFASVIYSADGQELGRYFRPTGNRVYADYDEISQNVINALVATEDVRFKEHSGIDIKAVARAVTKTLLMG